MYSKRFYIELFIRIALILAVCIAIATIISIHEKWFTIFGLVIILLLLIFELVRFIIQVGNSISDLTFSLIYNETSMVLSKNRICYIDGKFIDSLRELQRSVEYIKSEQVIQALFIQSLLEHVDVGIIALLPDGKIKFRNDAVLRLLNLKSFKSIESIKEIHYEFYNCIIACKPGDDKLLTLILESEVRKISLKSTRFISKGEDIKLIFFQDIKNEIDESLLQSWQNLIRILTHEINNTVAPIASLADSLSIYLSTNGNRVNPISNSEIDQRSIDVSLEGVNIIKERSNGLIDFVSKYRSLLPKKSISVDEIQVSQMFYKLKILFNEGLQNSNISIVSEVTPEDLIIKADQHYIEQVIINLVTNAIEAFFDYTPQSKATIKLKSFINTKGERVIQVIDNGKGISPENLDKVFLPFYSTKEKGTGVGLSLSMQIIKLHRGTIHVISKELEGTVFTIKI